MYGDHAVSRESLSFLTAIEDELGKEWVERNLRTGNDRIRLNEKGDIIFLDCTKTKITSLPELPAGLQHLDCSYNDSITIIPKLPTGLTTLYCDNTQITTLPDLPLSLIYISIGGTPLALDSIRLAELKEECKAKGITLWI